MPDQKIYTAFNGAPSQAIKYDGFCYEYVQAVPPDGKTLVIPEAFFDSCDACILGIQDQLSSDSSASLPPIFSSSSVIDVLIGLLLETGFNLLLEDGNIILLE